MNGFLIGFLSNLGWDASKATGSWLWGDSVKDRLEYAAEDMADEYDGLESEDLMNLMGSEEMANQVETFRQGEPLPMDELIKGLEDHPVDLHLEDDAEVVIERFLRAFMNYLTEDPELCQQVMLQYIKAQYRTIETIQEDQGTTVEALQTGIRVLKKEVEELSELVEPDELDQAFETLHAQGFIWLEESNFEGTPDNPALSYRRPFEWNEIKDDFAIDRQRPNQEETVTEELLGKLRDGSRQLLLGPPGSGKTTICKQVAEAWYDTMDGPVLYRESSPTGQIDDVHALQEAIETATNVGSTLVVVEDAVRQGSIAVFELLKRLDDDRDIGILLDARENEWDQFEDRLRKTDDREESTRWERLHEEGRSLVDVTRVPLLTEPEVKAILNRFVEKTGFGEDLLGSSEAVFRRITTAVTQREVTVADAEAETAMGDLSTMDEIGRSANQQTHLQLLTGEDSEVSVASAMLQLSFLLPVGDEGRSILDETGSPLERHVESVYESVTESEQDLAERVGLTVALLSAADLPVQKEFLHAQAEAEGDHDEIEAVCRAFQGELHFGTAEGTRLYAPHELWSQAYLRRHAQIGINSRRIFEETINPLFELLDYDDRRRNLIRERYFNRETRFLDLVQSKPEEVATVFVHQIFEVGRQQPALAELFWTTEGSGIEFPESCSAGTKMDCSIIRARMFQSRAKVEDLEYDNDNKRWVDELNQFKSYSEDTDIDSSLFEEIYYNQLAQYAFRQGDYEAARHLSYRNLERTDSQNDPTSAASTWLLLGTIATRRGDFTTAGENLHKSFEALEEPVHKTKIAKVHNGLGTLAKAKEDYETAREHYNKSLTIAREIDDRGHEARSLGNLGDVAREQGNYETARKHIHESLAIHCEIGDRREEAMNRHNLGLVAFEQDDIATARQRLHKSLCINREIGETPNVGLNLLALGVIALDQDDYEAARQHLNESLAIHREMDARRAVAMSLSNLGSVDRAQDNLESAQERYKEGSEIFCELGTVNFALKSLDALANVADERGDTETALDARERGLSIIEESNRPGLTEQAANFDAHVQLLRETSESTMEIYHDALFQSRKGGRENAIVLLGKTWERRGLFDPDDDVYQMILGAGIGLLAHMEMGVEASASVVPRDEDDINTAIESYSGNLSPPAKALYDHLMDEGSVVTPTEVRNNVQHIAGENSVKTRVQRLEAHAYADLLFLLTEDSLEDLPPIKVYEKALREANDETPDSEETKALLKMAWNRRDDHESETESYATTMAAGVGLAAYLELFEPAPENQVQEDVLDEIAAHTDALSPAAKAVFDQLTDNESTVTPDQLCSLVDKSVEEPTVTELEILVHADLLERLRET